MARKSNHAAGSAADVRAKAQAMRLQQEAADRRIRNIIIAIASTLIIAIVATVAWFVATAEELDLELTPEKEAALLGDYADGKPIVVSHKGVGVADDALPTVEEYFDYSCPACATADFGFGKELIGAAQDGTINLVFHPVTTHAAPWHFVATGASVIVADKAPEKWVDFHEAAMNFVYTEGKAGRGSTVNNATASFEAVKEVAKNAGVPQEVIDTFPAAGANNYLMNTYKAWQESKVEGREGFGTPEFVANGKKIQLTGFDAATAVPEILGAVAMKDAK